MAAARKTNWFAIWISVIAVVAIVAVGILVVWMNAASTVPGEDPKSSHINVQTGAISFGEGDQSMATYIDFMCPVCNQFEQVYGDAITGLKDDGTITLDLHPISILDHYSQGTEYSTRSASAMYAVAVADYDHALDFMRAMFENQPTEQTSGLTDDQIIQVAEAAGVTITDDLRTAITSHRYADFVARMTDKTPVAPGAAGIGTPTVAINGEAISNSTLPDPADLKSLFTK